MAKRAVRRGLLLFPVFPQADDQNAHDEGPGLVRSDGGQVDDRAAAEQDRLRHAHAVSEDLSLKPVAQGGDAVDQRAAVIALGLRRVGHLRDDRVQRIDEVPKDREFAFPHRDPLGVHQIPAVVDIDLLEGLL